jgi:hypothetical protein
MMTLDWSVTEIFHPAMTAATRAIALRIHPLGSPIFGNGTVTTRSLLYGPAVPRYLIAWGIFS